MAVVEAKVLGVVVFRKWVLIASLFIFNRFYSAVFSRKEIYVKTFFIYIAG